MNHHIAGTIAGPAEKLQWFTMWGTHFGQPTTRTMQSNRHAYPSVSGVRMRAVLSTHAHWRQRITATTNRFQQLHGTPVDSVVGKVRDHMHSWVQEFIRSAPFLVMATADADGNCDASPKGGKPGFVHVIDDRHLLIPDLRGNNLFQSYGNLDENPHVGLIFLIPGVNHTARANGHAEVVDQQVLDERGIELSVYDPDEKAALQQGMLVTVHEAYGQCPRSLNFARLWDTDTIESHRSDSPISRRPPGV